MYTIIIYLNEKMRTTLNMKKKNPSPKLHYQMNTRRIPNKLKINTIYQSSKKEMPQNISQIHILSTFFLLS